jgi:hypothetical protein
MAKIPMCLVCNVAMEPGFMTDVARQEPLSKLVTLPRWCQGTPEPNFWNSGVSVKQVEQGLIVIAYRCPECEALRLYAPSPKS